MLRNSLKKNLRDNNSIKRLLREKTWTKETNIL